MKSKYFYRYILLISLILLILQSCSHKEEQLGYFQFVNSAELAICSNNFDGALELYKKAFQIIDKPFGKDLYNAALLSGIQKDSLNFRKYLGKIINNLDDYRHLKQIFMFQYGFLSEDVFQSLLANKVVDYDSVLVKEMAFIRDRDQLFRPMYDTHMDTIEVLRKLNLNRIIELSNATGFPSHRELGYPTFMRHHDHYIVLHHTAQRRSQVKSTYDMLPLLRRAVDEHRIDPEIALQYLSMQNDADKSDIVRFEVRSYRHELLPEGFAEKQFIPKFDHDKIQKADSLRSAWSASSIKDIKKKALYLNSTSYPFIFSSVQLAVGNLKSDMSKEEILEQMEAIEYFSEPLNEDLLYESNE